MLNRRHVLAASFAAPFASHLSFAGAAEAAPLLIDSHVHVWKRDPAFPFAQGRKPPEFDASAEMLLALMQANGVSRTVIVQVIHYRWDNSYLADVLKRYPDKFQGICRVNPEDPAAPEHLSRLTLEQGFRGVRLSPSDQADGDWIRGPLMPPLWRRCAELKVPMTVLASSQRMADLVPLIEANPDLTVVIDHMADALPDQPQQLDALLALARFPKVFVKISHVPRLSKQAYPYADAFEQVKRVIERFGAGRCMWGTDWPISLSELPYDKMVAVYRDNLGFLSAADRQQILSGTVQKIWPFGL